MICNSHYNRISTMYKCLLSKKVNVLFLNYGHIKIIDKLSNNWLKNGGGDKD